MDFLKNSIRLFSMSNNSKNNCNKCEHLKKCISQGRVINIALPHHDFTNYIVGIGSTCLKDENKCIELFGKKIEEMTEDEVLKNLKKLKDMVGMCNHEIQNQNT